MSVSYSCQGTDCRAESTISIHEQPRFLGEYAILSPSTSRETKL
jgi:hypothetical protein